MPKAKSEDPVVKSLDDKQEESFILTGITELDEFIGGIPRGRVTELWGQEGVGKSHLITMIMAGVAKDKKILLVDAEFSFNKQRALDMGVNLKNVDYIADARLERVCELLVASVGKYDLIILDSLAYLTPLTVDTNEIGEVNIGLFARLIKHWVVKFRPRLGISQTAFIAINQYRAPIGMYIKSEPPGGKSWGHAVDLRLYLSVKSSDKIMKGATRVGHWLSLEIRKNKLGTPYRTTKIRIDY